MRRFMRFVPRFPLWPVFSTTLDGTGPDGSDGQRSRRTDNAQANFMYDRIMQPNESKLNKSKVKLMWTHATKVNAMWGACKGRKEKGEEFMNQGEESYH